MLQGRRINGRYKIVEMIGGGGMANVYLAHDMILDRDVALKILRLDFANDEEFIRRFHREAQSATSLTHPNIVSIYDVGEEDGIYYIVMEYVAGQTLKQYIQRFSPVSVTKVVDIMEQLTSAIEHAHHNHIIHRDIKPQNILIDDLGHVKITDFGIAMALSATSITQTNSVLGSVHYLSPEQARGGMANKKSDIYSLGIVMFELLTGRLPFSGESAVSIALKHLQSETPSLKRWNPNIPQSIENVVLKATAKDSFHRYDSVEEMEEDLKTALDSNRMNEEKFVIPIDDDATKAIPIITNDRVYKNIGDTIVHHQDRIDSTIVTDVNPSKKKKSIWPKVLISSFVILVLLAVLTVTVLPNMLKPKDIEIPDVSGKTEAEAAALLIKAGFEIGETIGIPDEIRAEGEIVKTDPKAGKFVKEGYTIDLYKSIGREKVTLSDYSSRQYDEVYSLLIKEYKNVAKIETHDNSEPGTIIEQDPKPDSEVIPSETVITFTVSKGPEKIVLEDLKGYNEKWVYDYVDRVGLVLDKLEEEYSDTVEKGEIISQKPAPGTKLDKGGKITVVISKGKEELPPKPVTETITVEYTQIIEGATQEVIIYIQDAQNNISDVYKILTITETTDIPLEFLVLPDKTAYYKIFTNDGVVKEGVIEYPESE